MIKETIRIFVDFEFIEHGLGQIDIVSIGMVDEEDNEYYAINTGIMCAYFTGKGVGDWVKENVFPQLTSPEEDFDLWRCPEQMKEDVLKFVGNKIPEFWGYFSAHDYVLLCGLMGGFEKYPDDWPMYINDVRAINHYVPVLEMMGQEYGHHALADAKWTREFYNSMAKVLGCGLLDPRLEWRWDETKI